MFLYYMYELYNRYLFLFLSNCLSICSRIKCEASHIYSYLFTYLYYLLFIGLIMSNLNLIIHRICRYDYCTYSTTRCWDDYESIKNSSHYEDRSKKYLASYGLYVCRSGTTFKPRIKPKEGRRCL
jgi:hypothetical protein